MVIRLVRSFRVVACPIIKRVRRRYDSGVTDPEAFGYGGKGIRTPGLLIANETLYQLSYTPETLSRARV
jgi:hypothetical protein